MNQPNGLVVTGGHAPAADIEFEARERWLVVAADSGATTAENKRIVPDAIVGDMDSLEDTELIDRYPNAIIERYDRAKEWTDTEIALKFLWKRDIEAVTIIGGGGGRIDHLIGILALFDRERYPQRWLTDREEILVVDEEIRFTAPDDGIVSFFPIGKEACTMKSDGLRWELDGIRWTHGDVGISNECRKRECRVTMVSGRLLMVRSLPNQLVL